MNRHTVALITCAALVGCGGVPFTYSPEFAESRVDAGSDPDAQPDPPDGNPSAEAGGDDATDAAPDHGHGGVDGGEHKDAGNIDAGADGDAPETGTPDAAGDAGDEPDVGIVDANTFDGFDGCYPAPLTFTWCDSESSGCSQMPVPAECAACLAEDTCACVLNHNWGINTICGNQTQSATCSGSGTGLTVYCQ